MKDDLQVGQMLFVVEMMDVYPRRAKHQKDFDDMLYSDSNTKACPGDIFTVVERSEPRFPRDDTWYRVIAPSGSVAWVMACHGGGVFYDVVPEDCN